MHDIVHELTIHAAPEVVFNALTTARGMARWWGPGCTEDLEPDAVVTLPLDGATTSLLPSCL